MTAPWISAHLSQLATQSFFGREGRVRKVAGSMIACAGPDASVGELCEVEPRLGGAAVLAEVIGVRDDGVVLMPYGRNEGISAGCRVRVKGEAAGIRVGAGLLGRVVNGFAEPLDGLGPISDGVWAPLRPPPINALSRAAIDTPMPTGVRVIDGLLPLGKGQRIGVFAGSGVGKSSLLGSLARGVQADVNVIALIGERGREVREFVEHQLDADSRRRTVVVTATSDEPALTRVRATLAALTIAEHFRSQGKDVFLSMDSVTRYAMARREIGLAAGEPPTARGYTPSVFAEIPELCERCGRLASGGSITAVFSVLVEGDDFNEPVADTLRATLDGHIVLTRELAHRAHFPAVDVLQSASRLLSELTSEGQRALIRKTLSTLALLARNRQMVDLGAYQAGSNPALDEALLRSEALDAWLQQERSQRVSRDDAFDGLQAVFAAEITQ